MLIKEEKTTLEVVDIQCDICEQSCSKGLKCTPEYAKLDAHWGYDSNKDTEHHECHMCEECYDKVADFIDTLGKSPTIRVDSYM